MNLLREDKTGTDYKESTCNAGDLGLIPGWERSPGEGNAYLLKYSCLGNPMGRAAWRAIVHGVTKSHTLLNQLSTHAQDSYKMQITLVGDSGILELLRPINVHVCTKGKMNREGGEREREQETQQLLCYAFKKE